MIESVHLLLPGRCPPGPGASVARRAADAITNLAHENVPIKSCVRAEGGIDPLVHLLESFDAKARYAACRLRASRLQHSCNQRGAPA